MNDLSLAREDFTSSAVVPDAEFPKYYSEALEKISRERQEIVCLGVDLSVPTESDGFRNSFPDRFFMIGR